MGTRKYIICNADEGDPGAFSDKWLLEERPHSVLFGMMAAGMVTGADTGILYIRGEYPEAVTADYTLSALASSGYSQTTAVTTTPSLDGNDGTITCAGPSGWGVTSATVTVSSGVMSLTASSIQ